MKCPKCGKEGARYLEKRKKKEIKVKEKGKEIIKVVFERDNNKAKCPKCKWEGEM